MRNTGQLGRVAIMLGASLIASSSGSARGGLTFGQGTEQYTTLAGSSNSGFTQDSSLYSGSNSYQLAGTGYSSYSSNASAGTTNGYQVSGSAGGSIGFLNNPAPSFTIVSVQLNSAAAASNPYASTSNDAATTSTIQFTFTATTPEQISLTATANTGGADSGTSASLFGVDARFFIESLDDQGVYAQLESKESSGNLSAGGPLSLSAMISLPPGNYEFFSQVSTQAYAQDTAANSSANLAVNFAIVPEPSSIILCGFGGLVGVAVARCRRARP